MDAVVLDMPEGMVDEVLRRLAQQTIPAISTWSRPCPSPGDRLARRTFYGYTTIGLGGGGLQGHILVRTLQALFTSSEEVLIGHTAILNDPAALVADAGAVDGFVAARALATQMLLLSPRRAVLLTASAHELWERELTRQSESPTTCITQISWRPSTRGGNP